MNQKVKITSKANKKDARALKSKQFDIVEIDANDLPYIFQFKIWQTNSKSMFIVVKEPSKILNSLKKDNIINIKYYSSISSESAMLDTKIEYITKDEHGRFKGHYLVGLKILKNHRNIKVIL